VKRTLALSLVILLISTGLGLAEPAETPKPLSWPDPDRLSYEEIKFSPPKPERVVLENGLTVYFLEDRELPLVNISFIVGAGSVFEPPGKEGLAEMTGDVMRTGGAGKLGGTRSMRSWSPWRPRFPFPSHGVRDRKSFRPEKRPEPGL